MRVLLLILFLTSFLYTDKKADDISKIDKNMSVKQTKTDNITWLNPQNKPFKILGLNWIHKNQLYRRLPLTGDIKIPTGVDRLANHTAGGQLHFSSNSKRILIKVKTTPYRPMYHMPQTAQAGFDIYIERDGVKKFAGISKMKAGQQEFSSQLYYNYTEELQTYTINFPLYNGIQSLEIGIDKGSLVTAPPPFKNPKPIVVYGTSITQGACASRPGMAYTNILSRLLQQEVINLGFSGSGKGEPELAQLISNINNKSLVILDIECNTHESLRKVLKPFIQELRTFSPTLPILILSRIPLARDLNPANVSKRESLKDFQENLVNDLTKGGDQNLYFLNGLELIKGKWAHEATVDGTHATDLGFMMMAENLEPHVRKILNQP